MREIVAVSCLGLAILGGCGGDSEVEPPVVSVSLTRDAFVAISDPLGESVKKVVYLDQNWTAGQSLGYYSRPQGSQLVPYVWFLALEQADSDSLFRDNQNILKYRYLPRNPGLSNPDGLPVGFVEGEGVGRRWLGFTCAACHTNEIRLGETGYRIDGAPAQADAQAFLSDLSGALKKTRDDPAKFGRFAAKVLKSDDPSSRADLKDDLTKVIKIREGYNLRNFPGFDPNQTSPVPPTRYGRLDAVDSIVNEAFWRTVKDPDPDHPTVVAKPCDAPVSYPFLWDTPQLDFVEWLGIAKNGDLGSSIDGIHGDFSGLPRNVGEVLGVFGDFTIHDNPSSLLNPGYSSSVKFNELIALNSFLKILWSPEWPAEFPKIDAAAAALGAELYKRPSAQGRRDSCLDCHAVINRRTLDRGKISVATMMEGSGTDSLAYDNFFGITRPSGKLEGERFFTQPKIQSPTNSDPVLSNVVTGVLLGFYKAAPPDPLKTLDFAGKRVMRAAPQVVVRGVYKGRPLDGIWATAPYLHNGSVPTLDDLLKPVDQRPKAFSIGVRTFDPSKVGYLTDVAGFPKFQVAKPDGTVIPGNSNAGHPYGTTWTAEERTQVIEYLKTL
ncbi:di-heme-cytochrome C peroxidase [Isosphaeraceae bacterium EP7]